ncbi:MAG: protein kinase domain-containing protein, partial [Acidobacteriota bacterium]
MIGRTLSHFRIIDRLGAGGMGVVYRAHDEQLDRDVAFKVLPSTRLGDPSARARLLREARTASKLNHPNICTIYEVGEDQGQAFIAMELVEGRPLSALLEGGALPVEQVQRYALQLSDALAHAHERGIIHRDLKSANVMITNGRAKLLDFGLAKPQLTSDLVETATRGVETVTSPGTVAGTLAYMAPEQLRGRRADVRSDVWALGVVLYEMATGVRPFGGRTTFELTSAILSQPRPPLPAGPMDSMPPGLVTVIDRCLEKDPDSRYQQSSEVRAALEAVQSGVAVPGFISRRRRVPRRVRLALAAVFAAILVIVGAVITGLNLEGLRDGLLRGAAPANVRSLAVLPLENLSGDPAQEYFADGMTEALITDLSKLKALKVTARRSVMRFKGTAQGLPEIARALRVETLLTGSVIREAGRTSIRAQLYDAAMNQQVWADRYE